MGSRQSQSRARAAVVALVLCAGFAALLVGRAGSAAGIAPVSDATTVGLKVDAASEPLGIDTPKPRFSWRMDAQRRGVAQSAFQVVVASSPDQLSAPDVWDSGRIDSAQPWVDYAGPELESHTRYFWTVRTWDERGSATEWATPSWFETAFMDPSEWASDWITRPLSPVEQAQCEATRGVTAVPREDQCPPSPILRTEFEVAKPVASARLYASGLGYGVYHLNGERVGDMELSPGFPHYDVRVFYTTSDVTGLIGQGSNAIGVELGRGYYGATEDGLFTGNFAHAPWRDEPKLRLELHLTYADGTTEVVGSDPSWKATTGPTIYDNLYRGTTYDGARAAELGAWTEPGYDDGAWQDAAPATPPNGALQAHDLEPDRPLERRPFVSVDEPQPGVFVFDLGQLVSGWTEIRVRGNPGDEVTLAHGSGLNPDGTVLPAPSVPPITGDAENTDVYRLAGGGQLETYHPQFAYHGFKYVQVTGWPGPSSPTLDDLTAEVIHADLRPTGEFTTSDRILNRTVDIARWTLRDSAHEVPIGDPNSEKAGWMGDGQFVAPSYMWLLDAQRFYTKWSRDMEDSQAADGEVSEIAPGQQIPTEDAPETGGHALLNGPTASFDAALFTVPWFLYRYYGDIRPLAERYDAMKSYLEYVHRWAPQDFFPAPCPAPIAECFGPGGIGDQRTPQGNPGDPESGGNPFNRNSWPDSNAWLYHMEHIAAETAKLLGHQDDAALYEARAESTKAQYNETFFDPDAGHYVDPDPNEPPGLYSQTVNAEALEFGLVPDELRDEVAASLAADIRERDHHLSTGATGTRFLWPALSHNGYLQEAVLTAEQKTYPGYGYWIDELGFTVLYEDWEGGRPEMFKGSVIEWFFEELAGIEPLKPGFEQIEFRPGVPERALDWVRASHDSIRGEIASAWQKNENGLELKLTLPPNSTGLVYVPATDRCRVTESGLGEVVLAEDAEGVELIGSEAEFIVYRVGSGDYTFQAWNRPPDLDRGGCGVDGPAAGARCPNRIEGTSKRDKLSGSDGADRIIGKRGNDRLKGRRGDDCLLGKRGRDRLAGNGGGDDLRGGAGKDKLRGNGGADLIRGGRAKDKLKAGGGNDIVRAARGGADRIDCGPGEDTAVVNEGKDRVRRCEKVKLR